MNDNQQVAGTRTLASEIAKIIMSGNVPTGDLTKMIALANAIAADDGEQAVDETLYGYLIGAINWRADYAEVFNIGPTE